MIVKEAMVLLDDDSLVIVDIKEVENGKNWVLSSTAIMHRAAYWRFGSIQKAHTLLKYLHQRNGSSSIVQRVGDRL